MSGPLRLGISTCLLGDPVRWDGSHERLGLLADVLGPHVAWVRVCPELEAGLGVPREPIAFVRRSERLVLLGARSREDVGPRVGAAADRILRSADAQDLDGWVLASRSPSCGLDGARIYATPDDLAADGDFERAARGLFAEAVLRTWPRLPIVDETSLGEVSGLEHFVERCWAMRRVRASLGDAPDPATLATFHDRHELQVLTRSAEAWNELVALVERSTRDPEAGPRWIDVFAAAMAIPPTREGIAVAFRRAAHRLRRHALPGHQEVEWSIGAFAAGAAPFDDVVDLLREAAGQLADDLLLRQTLLDPDPGERALRAAMRVAAGRLPPPGR